MIIRDQKRCRIMHRARKTWKQYPLCRASFKWVRFNDDSWYPCDEKPALFDLSDARAARVINKRKLMTVSAYTFDSCLLTGYGCFTRCYSYSVLKRKREPRAGKRKGIWH